MPTNRTTHPVCRACQGSGRYYGPVIDYADPERRERLTWLPCPACDGEQVLFAESDVLGFAAAILLMARGRVPKPDDRHQGSYVKWVEVRVNPDELAIAFAEVRAMTPSQRGDFIRPFLGDHDA